MRFRPLIIAASLLVVVVASQAALAVPPFAVVFKKEYLESNEHKEFAEEAGKAPNSCLVCHQGLKSRKNRNDFGKVVGKLLTKKDAKNTEKIATELKKALDMHVDPKDDKSETYLDRVKAGKYPVGDLAELKKEPAKSAGADEEKK